MYASTLKSVWNSDCTIVNKRYDEAVALELPGAFGDASGAPIYIMGISHAEIINGNIHREWILIDELAIHRQIRLHKG